MDINVTFTRMLLSALVEELRAEHPGVRVMKNAWVIKVGRDHWEFHGNPHPSGGPLVGFYWHGRAFNAYEARYKGLSAWREEQARKKEAAAQSKGFVCSKCTKAHEFTAYVAAHWDTPLVHTCTCGARHEIINGTASYLGGGIKSRKKEAN